MIATRTITAEVMVSNQDAVSMILLTHSHDAGDADDGDGRGSQPLRDGPQAEQRVRMGLVVADLVRANELQATAEQIKQHIEDLAASYEKPADVVKWYYSDMSRLGQVEAMVIENNVTEFINERLNSYSSYNFTFCRLGRINQFLVNSFHSANRFCHYFDR